MQEQYIAEEVDIWLPEIGIPNAIFVVNNFFRAWGHKFIYDFKTLKNLVEISGFSEVIRRKPGVSGAPNFMGIESRGLVIGEEFNNLESMVLEALKRNN